jgi:6-phosphogluconate dehydrogenase
MAELQRETADIGLIGLAVMGQNLILNMNDHGYTVTAYNRTVSKVDDFLNGPAKDTKVQGAHSIEELVSSLKKPRRVMLMVKAGDPVDDMIEQLTPRLEPGDIIIDGGNSLFTDTIRRMESLEGKGLLYIGTGISGGEDGARHGPSIMPGGSAEAWPHVKDIFQAIAARGDQDLPCCDWVGNGGAGHYVKMVHNGIEYGDMQLIAETYDLLRTSLGLSPDAIADVFDNWNKGELDSYLIQITADILRHKDEDGSALLDKILDAAGQKGTGKWTAMSSAELSQPTSVITEALYARFISALKDERVEASKSLHGPDVEPASQDQVEAIGKALYAAKIISYTQGYMMMRAAAKEYGWQLNYGGIAQMWTGGCIIRSRFLVDIKKAYSSNADLTNLMLDQFFTEALNSAHPDLRTTISLGIKAGVPLPALSSALSFYDAYRSEKLPANLVQAQRDYFGAHTYERVDKPRGEFFHTNWTGHGGNTSSSSYNA